MFKSSYRALALTGPRQSGKTTLAKKLFPKFDYLSLEEPNTRSRAALDPVGFLNQISNDAIIDEIQRFPELLSYLQSILDDKADARRFVLTGSNSLLLSAKVSQSLAERTRILHVLPLRFFEIPETIQPATLNEALYAGGYPRVYDEKLNPTEWLGDYFKRKKKSA